MHNYSVKFHGRRAGALGVTYEIVHTIESATPIDREAVIERLYEKFEHIGALEIEELETTPERKAAIERRYRMPSKKSCKN